MSAVAVQVPILPFTHAVTVSTFANCTADEFDPGVLTITGDSGALIERFPSDAWISATVYGEGGYPLFTLKNDIAWQAHVASRELRRRSA